MTTAETLERCYIDGDIIKLPDVTLDRADYNEVKKHFEAIQGKWDRKAQGFVFPDFVNLSLALAKLNTLNVSAMSAGVFLPPRLIF